MPPAHYAAPQRRDSTSSVHPVQTSPAGDHVPHQSSLPPKRSSVEVDVTEIRRLRRGLHDVRRAVGPRGRRWWDWGTALRALLTLLALVADVMQWIGSWLATWVPAWIQALWRGLRDRVLPKSPPPSDDLQCPAVCPPACPPCPPPPTGTVEAVWSAVQVNAIWGVSGLVAPLLQRALGTLPSP
jgi:hypothetical protein